MRVTTWLIKCSWRGSLSRLKRIQSYCSLSRLWTWVSSLFTIWLALTPTLCEPTHRLELLQVTKSWVVGDLVEWRQIRFRWQWHSKEHSQLSTWTWWGPSHRTLTKTRHRSTTVMAHLKDKSSKRAMRTIWVRLKWQTACLWDLLQVQTRQRHSFRMQTSHTDNLLKTIISNRLWMHQEWVSHPQPFPLHSKAQQSKPQARRRKGTTTIIVDLVIKLLLSMHLRKRRLVHSTWHSQTSLTSRKVLVWHHHLQVKLQILAVWTSLIRPTLRCMALFIAHQCQKALLQVPSNPTRIKWPSTMLDSLRLCTSPKRANHCRCKISM